MGKLNKDALHLFKLKYPSIKKVMLVAQWHPGVQTYLNKSKTGRVVLRRVSIRDTPILILDIGSGSVRATKQLPYWC